MPEELRMVSLGFQMNSGETLTVLHKVIKRLSLDADRQIAYLNELGAGNCADELALELEDIVGILPTLVECGTIPGGFRDRINSLDRRLESMSGEANAALWTNDGLRSLSEWEEVREMARQILASWPVDV